MTHVLYPKPLKNPGSYWAHGKVALVIGNSDFENHPKLLGAEKDVGVLTDVLRNQLGFEVRARSGLVLFSSYHTFNL